MANDTRDEETGRFEENYPAEEFIGALNAAEGATTAQVAERVGCDRDTAYRRLRSLAESECVERRQVGNSLLWSSVE